MKKIIKLTESDLIRLVKKVIKEEDGEYLRGELHALVGKVMKLEKRMEMRGNPDWMVEEYEEAEKELKKFLQKHPSMNDYLEEVENHFIKRLYQ
jgi:hypothetical protein